MNRYRSMLYMAIIITAALSANNLNASDVPRHVEDLVGDAKGLKMSQAGQSDLSFCPHIIEEGLSAEKSSDQSVEKEIKELKRSLAFGMSVSDSLLIFLDCYIRLTAENTRRLINMSNQNGYLLAKEDYLESGGIDSILSSYHDKTYADDLREADLLPICINPVEGPILIPVKGDEQKLAYLKFCKDLQPHGPIPHFNLIDYKNFLAWKVAPSNHHETATTYLTVVCKNSTFRYAEIKMYNLLARPNDEITKSNIQRTRDAIAALLQHLLSPRRAVAFKGYQFEVAMNDNFSLQVLKIDSADTRRYGVVAEFNLSKSYKATQIGIMHHVGRWGGHELTPEDFLGYRYFCILE